MTHPARTPDHKKRTLAVDIVFHMNERGSKPWRRGVASQYCTACGIVHASDVACPRIPTGPADGIPCERPPQNGEYRGAGTVRHLAPGVTLGRAAAGERIQNPEAAIGQRWLSPSGFVFRIRTIAHGNAYLESAFSRLSVVATDLPRLRGWDFIDGVRS